MVVPTGPGINHWSGLAVPSGKKASERFVARRIAAHEQWKKEDAAQRVAEDETLTQLTTGTTKKVQSEPSYPHALPGEQGKLFDMKPEKPEPEKPTKITEAEWNNYAQSLHQKLVDQGRLPSGTMKPSRQVAAYSARPSLPKAEGSQGTLYSPRKYR